jgi:hypothetical protein
VDDADRGGEAQLAGAVVDGARVLGVLDAAAEDGVDVDVEPCVGLEMLKLICRKSSPAAFNCAIRFGTRK